MSTNSASPESERFSAVARPYCGGQEPLFLAALAFAAGILCGNLLWRSPIAWLAACSVALAVGILSLHRSPQVVFACGLMAIVPLGALYLQSCDAAQPAIVEDLQPFGSGEGSVEVTAHVIREGWLRDSRYGGKQESVDIESEEMRLGDHVDREPVGIRLMIYSKLSEEEPFGNASASPLRVYRYGERLRLTAKLRMPRNYGNPGALDLTGYLHSQGIRLTGSAPAGQVQTLPGFAGNRLERSRSTVRRSVLEHINQLWPGEQGALMQAALVGGRAYFGRDIKSDFQRTGTYHILVVSGINVGILAFAVFWFLRSLPFGQTWATILTIFLSWGYAFVADLGAPIVRATITLNIYLLTRLLFRDRSGLNGLGIAALGILVVNPRTLFEASFQLTFLSVIAVAGIASPILQRAIYPLQTGLRNLDSPEWDYSHPSRAAEFRVEMRLLRRALQRVIDPRFTNALVVGITRLLLGALELLFVSVVINLALALPMAWYFHRATTMALPANALVIPIASVLLPTAVLAVACSYVSHWVAFLPAKIASFAMGLLTGTVRLIGHYRISDLRVPTPGLAVSIFAASTFVVAVILARRRVLAGVGIAALLASAVWIIKFPPKPQFQPGVLEVTAIDVGQGDSFLLVTPTGKTLLVDSGGTPGTSHSDFDIGEEVVSPYLWSRGIWRLDAIALSHAHSDHMGGMPSIIANFQPREFWYGVESPETGFQDIERIARSFDVQLKQYRAGDSFEYGGIHVRVLNPQRNWQPQMPPQDDESMVLHLQYGGTAALLVGDSHRRIEKFLIEQSPSADLLKIGHHGSLTSSSPEFLQAVHPEFAVVSVGLYNAFKHPRPEVMRRYADSHVITYRTDLAGAVSFYLNGQTVTAKPVLH